LCSTARTPACTIFVGIALRLSFPGHGSIFIHRPSVRPHADSAAGAVLAVTASADAVRRGAVGTALGQTLLLLILAPGKSGLDLTHPVGFAELVFTAVLIKLTQLFQLFQLL
jgi:hypothetical protein